MVEEKISWDNLMDFFREELNDTEFVPTYFEVRYGMKRPRFSGKRDFNRRPGPLKVAGKTINLRGPGIDRIDLTKDGKRARVRDYRAARK